MSKKGNYFFTADQHLNHRNIIKYCNRPFDSVEEMDRTIIENHNKVVGVNDIVIHLGDFTLKKTNKEAYKYINQLNGINVFIRGSHDRWLNKNHPMIWEHMVEGQFIVGCHYAMRVWARSHYNSWHIYGHSHGNLPSQGKSYDVGVDCNNFYPVSFDKLKEIMKTKEDNFNLVKKY